MKSIEKRADEYIGHAYEIDEFSEVTSARKAYIAGAEAQYKEDMAKACKWLKDLFDRDDFGLGVYTEKAIVQFRKTMEE